MNGYLNDLNISKRLTMPDGETIALQAIAWILADSELTSRFMGLSGLDSDSLRSGLGEPWLSASVLAFLCNHEPDLTACAKALDIAPKQFVIAAQAFSGAWDQ